MAADNYIYATGRRKTSSARIYAKAGTGKITINGKSADTYMKRLGSRVYAMQPLKAVGYDGKLDLMIRVAGGGESGQAGAIRHGLARVLVTMDAELRGQLKKAGFLTRDSRMVERKKYGLAGARRRFQYSKR